MLCLHRFWARLRSLFSVAAGILRKGSNLEGHCLFSAVKHKLADMKIFLEAARSLVYRIAWCKDQGRPLNHLEAAVAKLFIGDWSLAPRTTP